MESERTLAALHDLLGAVFTSNSFYSQRLSAAGSREDISCVAEFCATVPFTTKADLVADQAEHPPYGTNHTFPLVRYTRHCQTSGTTGHPLHILDTPESWDWMLENWLHIYRAAGLEAGQPVYFAFSFGPFLGFWTAFEAAAQCGLRCLSGGGLGSAARLRAIIEHRANVLLCTPTYALRLAEVARAEGIDLAQSAVEKIIVAGEPGGSVAEVRARIAAAWRGAEVLDHYGMTEIGPVAFQKSGEPGALHVIETSYLAEIIEPGGHGAVADGDPGELVLTTLGRHASPVLRYRTGDLVRRRAGAPGFVLEGGILGRVDDMVVIRGVNIYPSAIDAVIRRHEEIDEYRATVTSRGELAEIEIEIESGTDAAAARVAGELEQSLSLRIPVRIVAPGTLPRFEMKAQRWVRRA